MKKLYHAGRYRCIVEVIGFYEYRAAAFTYGICVARP